MQVLLSLITSSYGFEREVSDFHVPYPPDCFCHIPLQHKNVSRRQTLKAKILRIFREFSDKKNSPLEQAFNIKFYSNVQILLDKLK